MSVFFRDINLSNDISFNYAKMDPAHAAHQLFGHIMGIRHATDNIKGEHIVSIILDGENPWPYYHRGGGDFLRILYGLLNESKKVKAVTFSDHLKKKKPVKKIKKLAAGSWINGDFGKWIGSAQKKKAWEYLDKVRKEMFSRGAPSAEALRELYIAESSDWFWWYDDFGTEINYVFDDLYRLHLRNIYNIMGKEEPSFINEPVYDRKTMPGDDLPGMMAPPVIDGEITYDYEWVTTKRLTSSDINPAMAKTDSFIKEIAYGIDADNIYIMAEPNEKSKREGLKDAFLLINLGSPLRGIVEVPFDASVKGSLTMWDVMGAESKQAFFTSFAYKNVLEIKLPFAACGAEKGDEVSFRIKIKFQEEEKETWPETGFLKAIVP